MKKSIIAFCCAIVCQASLADRCPSVADIKNSSLRDWKAYDSDDGQPLSAAREAQFKKIIEQFALAEWSTKSKNQPGSIHCYYRDRTGSSLEAYFAKDNFIPKVHANSFWYQVSGFMHCAAGMEKCEFVTQPLTKNQLARK